MLTRWNPARELNAMRRLFDRTFGEDWPQLMEEMGSDGNVLAIDIDEDNEFYTVTASLPGVKADDVDIKVNGDSLTIDAEIPETVTEEKDDARVLRRERYYGRFSRTVRFPQTVNSDAAEATFADGVLRLHLPKSEESRAKSIPVKSGS
jgi:HSP20 family protein